MRLQKLVADLSSVGTAAIHHSYAQVRRRTLGITYDVPEDRPVVEAEPQRSLSLRRLSAILGFPLRRIP